MKEPWNSLFGKRLSRIKPEFQRCGLHFGIRFIVKPEETSSVPVLLGQLFAQKNAKPCVQPHRSLMTGGRGASIWDTYTGANTVGMPGSAPCLHGRTIMSWRLHKYAHAKAGDDITCSPPMARGTRCRLLVDAI